jgi:tryptophanyl-tRNA synthetase
MSLKEPSLKMSKSEQDSGSRIHLTDTPQEINQKIRLALTDSMSGVVYDPITRPGISNLLTILSHMKGEISPEALSYRLRSLTLREFKTLVALAISDRLSDFRLRYEQLMKVENAHYLDEVAAMGAEKARHQASLMLGKVRHAIGL